VATVAISSGPDPKSVPTPGAVAGRMMSPFCPGLTLEECPSEQAANLRTQIAAKVKAGATNREIDEWMVSNYGESVLARPDTSLAWLAPALAAAVGLLALLYLTDRRPKGPESPPPEIGEGDRARIREDMAEFLGRANE
jgi:cytochrome c-type biogenesis protein CcmH